MNPYRTPSIPPLPATPSRVWCRECEYSFNWGIDVEVDLDNWDCRLDDSPGVCHGPFFSPTSLYYSPQPKLSWWIRLRAWLKEQFLGVP